MAETQRQTATWCYQKYTVQARSVDRDGGTCAAGNLLVTGEANNAVLSFDGKTGASAGTFASGGLNGPDGLAYGPDGNLYVASYASSTVTKFNGSTGALRASGRPRLAAMIVCTRCSAASSCGANAVVLLLAPLLLRHKQGFRQLLLLRLRTHSEHRLTEL